MFTENKYITHFATHKNAHYTVSVSMVTVQCSLFKWQPEKSKV